MSRYQPTAFAPLRPALRPAQAGGCDCDSFAGDFGVDACFNPSGCACQCSKTTDSPCSAYYAGDVIGDDHDDDVLGDLGIFE